MRVVAVGLYRMALLPGVEPEAFEEHISQNVLGDTSLIQLTRITPDRGSFSGLSRARVRRPGDRDFTEPTPRPQYMLRADINLMTDAGYDFDMNSAAIQARVADFAVLTATNSYLSVAAATTGRTDSTTTMTGMYHLALLPTADPDAFQQHMTDQLFTDADVLQLTRISEGFSHELLSTAEHPPNSSAQYLWSVTVALTTDAGYDFQSNANQLQHRLNPFAVLTDVESYTAV
jgi:hypothetical protein